MNKVLYEAKPYYGMWISVPFLIFCIVTLLFIAYLIITWKKSSISGRCVGCFLSVFLLFIVLTQFYAALDSEKKVYGEYVKGNYNTAEGYITGYSTDYTPEGYTRYDYFYVSDVYFETPGFVSRWGYPLTKETGTQLDNGMYVKIHYITYKYENVIMYLELIE